MVYEQCFFGAKTLTDRGTGRSSPGQARLSYLRSKAKLDLPASSLQDQQLDTHNVQARTRQASGRGLERCESMYLMFEQRQAFVLTHPQGIPGAELSPAEAEPLNTRIPLRQPAQISTAPSLVKFSVGPKEFIVRCRRS